MRKALLLIIVLLLLTISPNIFFLAAADIFAKDRTAIMSRIAWHNNNLKFVCSEQALRKIANKCISEREALGILDKAVKDKYGKGRYKQAGFYKYDASDPTGQYPLMYFKDDGRLVYSYLVGVYFRPKGSTSGALTGKGVEIDAFTGEVIHMDN